MTGEGETEEAEEAEAALEHWGFELPVTTADAAWARSCQTRKGET